MPSPSLPSNLPAPTPDSFPFVKPPMSPESLPSFSTVDGSSQLPCCSECFSHWSEKHAATIGVPYVPAIQCAITTAHNIPEPPASAPSDPIPAFPFNDDDIWFTGATSDSGMTNSTTYQETMTSPHAAE